MLLWRRVRVHVQEPEEGKETAETPMVSGLHPPSPRPMVHDPLDRAENEPKHQPTPAELSRLVKPLCQFNSRIRLVSSRSLQTSNVAGVPHLVLSHG